MDKSKIKPEVREQVVNTILIAKEVISQYFKFECPDIVAEEIAFDFLTAGYGKVEDYKKEIERLKEENEQLKQALEGQFTFKTTQEGKTCNIFDIFRRVTIKEVVEKFWDKYHGDMKMGDVRLLLDRLLKEYGADKE